MAVSILRCLCPTVRPERFPVEKLKPVTKRVIPEMRVLIYSNQDKSLSCQAQVA